MRKISLVDGNNTVFEVDLVRYFEYDSETYLIYTLNETDEKGYLKLYLVEILEELGEPISYTINDNDDWELMQEMIKKVIKEIKAKTRELLKDWDPLEIDKIKIVDPRYFKLNKKLADILSLDYLENEDINVEVDDQEIDDMVIEAIDLPEDEVIILEKEESDMENETIEPVEISDPVVPTNEVSDEINYKELYFALKAEKEAMDEAFDAMLSELLAYKAKYGELEESSK